MNLVLQLSAAPDADIDTTACLLQIVLEYSPGAWEVNQKWEEYPMIAGMLDLCAPTPTQVQARLGRLHPTRVPHVPSVEAALRSEKGFHGKVRVVVRGLICFRFCHAAAWSRRVTRCCTWTTCTRAPT